MVRKMTDEHREANQRARDQNRAVGAYLRALEESRPRRGRRQTKESIQKKLDRIEETFESATPLKRVQLIQQRIDLEEVLAAMAETSPIEELETEFVKMAPAYSERKNISYRAWREMGVSASVLKRAGISYSRTSSG